MNNILTSCIVKPPLYRVPVIILFFVLCSYHLYLNGHNWVMTSNINALLGITGILLWCLNVRYYRSMFIVWSLAQVVIISQYKLDPILLIRRDLFNFDLTQAFSLCCGFNWRTETAQYSIEFNFIGVVLYLLTKLTFERSTKR